MKKIKFGLGGLLMLSAMAVSDSALVFLVYLSAAVLHEMGHLAAARSVNIGIKEVRFEFSGVRICTDSSLTSYKSEIFLAASGPAANLLAFCVSAVGWFAMGGRFEELFERAYDFMSAGGGDGQGMVAFFALSSLVQAAINLLPVASFDGGRILYCAVSEFFGENLSWRVVEAASAVSAFLLWTIALYLMLKVSSGLGIYVFAACIFVATLKERE